jgi:hypothetical protein
MSVVVFIPTNRYVLNISPFTELILICGAIPPLPQYAFIAWCSVKKKEAQGQNYLYLYLTVGKYV